MAGRRPAPGRNPNAKQPGERCRRNAPEPVTVVVADGEVHGPQLPDTHEWPEPTLRWWETWRASAMAPKFTETDWSFLLDTAVLHAEFWLGDRSVAGELRLRAAKFGATPEDRARLRIAVGEPEVKPGRLRTRTGAERRRRILKAVEGEPAQLGPSLRGAVVCSMYSDLPTFLSSWID